jgi:hypothetical protein
MRLSKTIRTTTALLVCAMGWGINGCCNYHASAPVSTKSVIPEGEDSADFLDRASELEIVDMDNALHGLSLLVDGQDTHPDFQSRVDKMSEKGLVPSDWSLSAKQPLTKGELAYMAYQACGIKEKGLVLSLFGPNRRYCLRELQYRGMMAPGGESMRVTGMEFVAVITRADTYKRTGLFPNDVGQPE